MNARPGASVAILLAIAAPVAPALDTPASAADRPPPNIVLILADDLGYGDPGCYNPDSRIPTPRIDALATRGMRFTDAHSPSAVCTPTRYGILTGRYGWRTWLKQGVVGGYTPPLIEPDRPTIASVLRAAGYRTGFFGKWHLGLGWKRANGFVGTAGNASEHFRGSWQDGDPAAGMNVDFTARIAGGPVDLGFDSAFFTAACSTIDGPFCFIENDRTVGIPNRPIPVDEARHPDFRPRPGWMTEGFDLTTVDEEFTRRAIAFIEGAREAPDGGARSQSPFLLILALSSPHAPWLPPSATAGTTAEGPRGDLVALVDRCVGGIAEALETHGLTDDTLVVFTSDNGPRHGGYNHRSAGSLRGHKSHIWEGGHRVPFIASWPGRIPEGATSATPIELTDLLATFCQAAGVEPPEDAGPDSWNMLPALLHPTPPPESLRPFIVSHSVFGVYAIRQGPWKLIEGTESSGGWVDPPGERPRPEAPGQLYHLAEDPGEQDNRFAAEPGIVQRLQQTLDSIRNADRSVPDSP